MKHVSISSLICGTAIVLAPIIHSLITLAMLAHLLALNPKGDFHLTGMLNDSYQSWCLFIGFCLLVTGTILGFLSRGSRSDAETSRAVSQSLVAPSNA